MRTITRQRHLMPGFVDRKHGRELRHISRILDANRWCRKMVEADLLDDETSIDKGRPGMTGEQVLRALIIKRIHGFSYRDLSFHLADSQSFRTFCRIGISEPSPRKSALQHNLSRVSAQTLEAINELIVRYAMAEDIEDGSKIRFDCTVVESDIHPPSDSAQLADVVRVLSRLFVKLRDSWGWRLRNRHPTTRKLARRIQYAKRKDERTRLYDELITATEATLQEAREVVDKLDGFTPRNTDETRLKTLATEQLQHLLPLADQVVDQTRRRVLEGEKVPARDKVVSIFEPHTDIIVRKNREVEFGHKICVATGESGVITDCMILDGNPADSTLSVQMIQRHVERVSESPSQTAADGGFASIDNVEALQDLGVDDAVFHKRCGIEIEHMTDSEVTYKELRNFRAGIEAWISYVKRRVNLGRCTWRGLKRFHSYVWSGIVAANLLTVARTQLE